MTATDEPVLAGCATFWTAPGTVRAAGELDLSNVDVLKELLARTDAVNGRVVVDLTDVSFVDVCSVGELLRATPGAPRRAVRNPPPILRTILEILELTDAIDVSYAAEYSIIGEDLDAGPAAHTLGVSLDAASARDLDLFMSRMPVGKTGSISRPVVAWKGTQRLVIEVHISREVGGRWQVRLGDQRTDDAAPDIPEVVDPRLENLSTMVWVTDADRLARWFNTQWLEFVGADLADELGWGWMRHVHPDDVVSLMEVYELAQDEQRGFEHVARVYDREGRASWLRVRAAPRTTGDEFGGFVGMCQYLGTAEEIDAPSATGLADILPVPSDGTVSAADVAEMLTRLEAALEISRPADTVEAAFLRRLASRWVTQHEGLRSRHDDIVLAVSEAAANTMVHAYRGQRGRVRLICELHGSNAEFRIRDWGSWLPPSPERDSRGLTLIEMVADDARIEHLPDGTEVVLQFALHASS